MKIQIDHTCMGLGRSPILFGAFLKQHLRQLAFFFVFSTQQSNIIYLTLNFRHIDCKKSMVCKL